MRLLRDRRALLPPGFWINSQTDNTQVGLFVRRVSGVVEDLTVSLFHLLECMGCVEGGCDGNIAAVYDAEAPSQMIEQVYWSKL